LFSLRATKPLRSDLIPKNLSFKKKALATNFLEKSLIKKQLF